MGSTIIESIRNAVVKGSVSAVTGSIDQALADGFDANTILNDALMPAMSTVGDMFECGEAFIPEMLIAGRAMQAGLALLKPLLVEDRQESLGTVAIGTVQGDLHDIGKNLVSMMLEGAGFTVKDLGTSVTPDKFITAAQSGAHILALSAMLTTTMPAMERTIKALDEAGLRTHIKVIIGGAPVTQAYADLIGADGYSPDASSAVRLAKRLAGSR